MKHHLKLDVVSLQNKRISRESLKQILSNKTNIFFMQWEVIEIYVFRK